MCNSRKTFRRSNPFRLYVRSMLTCGLMATTCHLPADEFEPFVHVLSLSNTTGDVTIAQQYNFDRRFPVSLAPRYLRFTWAHSNHRAQSSTRIDDADLTDTNRVLTGLDTNRLLTSESGRFQGNIWAFQNGTLTLRGDSSTLSGIYARLGGRTPDEATFDSFLHRGMDSATFHSLSITGNRLTGNHRGGQLTVEGTIEHLGDLEYRLVLDLNQVDIRYVYEVGLTNYSDSAYIPTYVRATYIRDGSAVNQEETVLVSMRADIAVEFDPHVLFQNHPKLSIFEIDAGGTVDRVNPDGTRTPIGRTETPSSRRTFWAIMIVLMLSPFAIVILERIRKQRVNRQHS
jgi:hypothetical protein